MLGRAVSIRKVLILGALVGMAWAIPAQAQLTKVKPPKGFKCLAKGESPFCLKNTSKKDVWISSLTVYSGAGGKGKSHSPIQSQNAADDLKLGKGETTCKCVNLVPKSYKLTTFTNLMVGGGSGDITDIAVVCAAPIDNMPLFSGDDVAVNLGEAFFFESTTDPGYEFYVSAGTSDLFFDATFTTLEGDLFEGWLTLVPIEAEDAQPVLEPLF